MTKRLSPAHRAYRKLNQKRRDDNLAREVELHNELAKTQQGSSLLKSITGKKTETKT